MRRSQRIAEHVAAAKNEKGSASLETRSRGRTKASTKGNNSYGAPMKKSGGRPAKVRRTNVATGDAEVQRRCASREVSTSASSRSSQSSVDHETVSTSPIQSLPTELISEIFLWLFTALMGSDVPNPIPTFVKAVSFVCAEWRHIAHGMPQLWTHIKPPGRRDWYVDNRIEAYLDHYLPLSNGRPLHLRLQHPHEAVLQQLAPRLQELRLVGIRGVRPITTPLLETALLTMSDLGPHPYYPTKVSLAFLQDAPRLKTLDLVVHSAAPDCELTLPPTARIEVLHLEIESVSFAALLPPLRQCRATLRELRLLVCRTPQASAGANQVIAPLVLPALQHLVLQWNAHSLLGFIAAPALESLSFEAQQGNCNVGEILLGYLNRVQRIEPPVGPCMLKSLHIEKVPMVGRADEHIERCLQLTPNLEELRIGEGAWRALGRLRYPYEAGKPIYVPKLKLLAVDFSEVWEPVFVDKGFLNTRMEPTVAFGTPVSAVRVVPYNEGGRGIVELPAREKFVDDYDSDTESPKRDVSSWLANCRKAK
ncbi:uncharacterized protein SCHCODRAFT_02580163 [Schizophyllum commune H4-8]|nr:uncharacterized protein SCHCODRAFT_02580163 [Schizophyllum commune H4-8]KAI5891000.1 hypothetical protein SCHCODRAFT_02580163 [Schizophyllum commune H4-8]